MDSTISYPSSAVNRFILNYLIAQISLPFYPSPLLTNTTAQYGLLIPKALWEHNDSKVALLLNFNFKKFKELTFHHFTALSSQLFGGISGIVKRGSRV